LEELLPKDNEKIPLHDLVPLTPSEVEAFSAEQMVRCEECLRANPPTRVNCLYCSASLPVTEKSANMQKPALRRLEQWEQGINIILVPTSGTSLSDERLGAAAELLKLRPDELRRVISSGRSLPLARAASRDEAELVVRRLGELGIDTISVADEQLRLDERQMVRIRSASIKGDGLTGYQLAGMPGVVLEFSRIDLLVLGRILVRRIEVKERTTRRAENDIVNSSEFFSDEPILDIYGEPDPPSWRIEAGSFDFSVLGRRKGLIAGENLRTLVEVIRELSPRVQLDESYAATRHTLEPVWPSRQRTEAGGWHRERPGMYSTSGIIESSNEDQFTLYSRLQYFLRLNSPVPVNEE